MKWMRTALNQTFPLTTQMEATNILKKTWLRPAPPKLASSKRNKRVLDRNRTIVRKGSRHIPKHMFFPIALHETDAYPHSHHNGGITLHLLFFICFL
jgi:hypothetical protein